jgi:hypothetical protein
MTSAEAASRLALFRIDNDAVERMSTGSSLAATAVRN